MMQITISNNPITAPSAANRIVSTRKSISNLQPNTAYVELILDDFTLQRSINRDEYFSFDISPIVTLSVNVDGYDILLFSFADIYYLNY